MLELVYWHTLGWDSSLTQQLCTLSTSLKSGGFLFGRFGTEIDEDQPQHIVKDFGPTFRRLQELGCARVWQDEWLWGHRVFPKPLLPPPQ
jgi:hypothetical protein